MTDTMNGPTKYAVVSTAHDSDEVNFLHRTEQLLRWNVMAGWAKFREQGRTPGQMARCRPNCSQWANSTLQSSPVCRPFAVSVSGRLRPSRIRGRWANALRRRDWAAIQTFPPLLATRWPI